MSGINQILSNPDLFSIVSYDFLRVPGQLFRVSKSVNQACQGVLKQKTLPELQLKSKKFWDATRTEAERLCGEEPFEVVVEKLYQQVGQKFHGGRQAFDSAAWSPLREFYDRYQREANSEIKKGLAYRLITWLHPTNVNMDRFDEDEHLLLLFADQQSVLLDPAQEYIIQERLACKVASVADPQPSVSLSRLRETQQRYILNRAQSEQFERIPRNMDPESLLAAERFAQEVDHARDLSLGFVWRSIRPRLPEGPEHNASAHVIRTWIENDDYLPILDRLNGTLQVNLSEACPVLPVELGRCRNLQRLECQGEGAHRLINLPEALSGMRSLESLRLEGHSFREIPAVLQRLPALRELSMRGNEHPIRVFPEWLDEKINTGFFRGFRLHMGNDVSVQMDRLDQFFGLRILTGRSLFDFDRNLQYAGLPHQELSDIPFNIWFRENFSIPNFSMYIGLGFHAFLSRLENIGQLYQAGWLDMIRTLTLPLLPLGFVASAVLWAPLAIASSLITVLLISSAAPLINLIVNFVICPMVEAVRDELGYDRMVHVRDFPEEPAAGSQA